MRNVLAHLPDGVVQVRGVGGLPALAVSGPRSSGVIQLHGGQVTSFVPAGRDEMLWLSPEAVAGPGAAIRGGVPVCFPWFGAGIEGDRSPSHGLARIARWSVTDARCGDGDVMVTFALTPTDVAAVDSQGAWPDGLALDLRVTFSQELVLELIVRNHGSATVTAEAALHTYLAVGDVSDVVVRGLAGSSALDQVTGVSHEIDGDVRFAGEVDLLVAAPGRQIDVTESGSPIVTVAREGLADAVVWNPHVAKSARLADVPDDAWPRFVCVEAAAVRENALTIEPGETRTVVASYAPRA